MNKLSYKEAGVDLAVYKESMSRLPALMHRTFSPRVIRQDGGFAGMFQLDFADKLFSRNYQDPILIACTDGVGTKLKVAQRLKQHRTIGIDLVAMCVNDALCCGAEPLMFLDYVAMSKDDPQLLEDIVTGISDGCVASKCALLGGETAILPDVYHPGEYDLAGFCVGVVDRSSLIDGNGIEEGDVAVGVSSSGLHSNGYSLVRKIVFEAAGLDHNDDCEALGGTIGAELIRPTIIYAESVRRVLECASRRAAVHGIAHVTGGGLSENIQRIVPAGVNIELQRGSWRVPPVFPWLQSLGDVDADEMNRVFNMGIGLVIIADVDHADSIIEIMNDCGQTAQRIGHVVKGSGRVAWADDATG